MTGTKWETMTKNEWQRNMREEKRHKRQERNHKKKKQQENRASS